MFILSIIVATITSANAQSIAGRVVSNDGTPIADANVVLQNSQQKYQGVEVTGADYTLYENRTGQDMTVDYIDSNVLHMKQDAGQKVRTFHAYADQSHSLGKGWALG